MSEILYRRALEEKLKDLSGELKTGRETFTWNSGLYKKLDKSISAVLKVLEEHSGEETLSEDVRKDLEEKIHQMKEAAEPYRDEKLKQGALSGGGLMTGRTAGAIEVTRKRFQAAVDILKVDDKIPKDPGAGDGIIAPDALEPGDVPQTNWRLKWKQNVRYLAKKQINTYEKKLSQYNPSGKLQQDEFDALMDLVEPEKLLTYKNDPKLCQMYPELRLTLEKAVNASEKIKNMTEDEIASYMITWSASTLEKSLNSAKKAKERQGKKFTESDRKNIQEKQELLIRDKIEKYSNKSKLITKGDVLYQVSRFVDLKMKVISDKNYISANHTNMLGMELSASGYDELAKKETDPAKIRYYNNLRDLRELEGAGIRHNKPVTGIDGAIYKKVDETLNRTVKREFLGFRVGKPGFKGVGICNSDYGAKDSSSTANTISVGQDSKLRVGKIGIKFHSKHKSLQLSSGVAFGQVKSSTILGASLNGSGINMVLLSEASAVRGRIKASAKGKYGSASAGGNISAGYVMGRAIAGAGTITVEDADGTKRQEYGVSFKTGAIATTLKGGGSGSVNILGLKVGVSFTAYAAGIGADFGTQATVGGVGFSLGGALGIGAGFSVTINWSEAVEKLKKRWHRSKLKQLIKAYKDKKRSKLEESDIVNDIKKDIQPGGLIPEKTKAERSMFRKLKTERALSEDDPFKDDKGIEALRPVNIQNRIGRQIVVNSNIHTDNSNKGAERRFGK